MLITYGCILLAYLLGAIPFGLLVARAYSIPDIRRVGSGNIGATNVWRSAGARAGMLVYFLDVAKGVAAVLLAKAVVLPVIQRDLFLVLCALAAVIGHVFPVYLSFKGGKGVSTALGVMISLLPIPTAIAAGVFILVVALTRYISLGSILGALALCAVVTVEKLASLRDVAWVNLGLCVVLAVVVIITHRENIARLLKGTEHRFSFSSGDKEGERS